MLALIDADILLHEIGWGCQRKDEEGNETLLGLDAVLSVLDGKIDDICKGAEADSYLLFLTGSEWMEEKLKGLRKYTPRLPYTNTLAEYKYQRCFRYDIAKTKPYKGMRQNALPYHYYNLLWYMLTSHPTCISTPGIEADDEICITHTRMPDESIICSRDKDLRMCPGLHYSWECGKQREVGPVKVDRLGWLEKKVEVNDKGKKTIKVVGYGRKFFYYQMLAGDAVDNIPGLPKWGPVKAYDLLHKCYTEGECAEVTFHEYAKFFGEAALDNEEGYKYIGKTLKYWLEQQQLLKMIEDEEAIPILKGEHNES